MKQRRPTGLLLIVGYKALVAVLMLITALALFLTLRNYQNLADLSESYVLERKLRIIEWGLEHLAQLRPRTLEFSALATGVYGSVTAIEAVGLWYQKSWARWLVLGLVGISILPEVVELFKSLTLLKLVVFLCNVGVFSYLLTYFPKQEQGHSNHR